MVIPETFLHSIQAQHHFIHIEMYIDLNMHNNSNKKVEVHHHCSFNKIHSLYWQFDPNALLPLHHVYILILP